MKRLVLSLGIAILLCAPVISQRESNRDSLYVKQIYIYNELKNVKLNQMNHCNSEKVLLVSKDGKLLKHDNKLVVSKKSKCLFDFFDVGIKSTHPDSIKKNLNFVELIINYSVKTDSYLPDTLSFYFIVPTEISNNENNKRVHYNEKLIITNSPTSGIINQEIKLKDFIEGQYFILFEHKNGEKHEYSFEMKTIKSN